MRLIGIKNLCGPAEFYLFISMVAIAIMWVQNYYNVNVYCLGNYSCKVSSTLLIFVVKIVYVLFWTWILNLICNAGLPMLSWFLVLIPFVIMFILVGALMLGY
jgi:hypothetical protein